MGNSESAQPDHRLIKHHQNTTNCNYNNDQKNKNKQNVSGPGIGLMVATGILATVSIGKLIFDAFDDEPAAISSNSPPTSSVPNSPSLSSMSDLSFVPSTSNSPLILPSTETPHHKNEDIDLSDANTSLCQICFEREIGAAYIPCGHARSCLSCARMTKQCPYCRADVASVLQLFL